MVLVECQAYQGVNRPNRYRYGAHKLVAVKCQDAQSVKRAQLFRNGAGNAVRAHLQFLQFERVL